MGIYTLMYTSCSFSFLCMNRHIMSSTLFPYTTLFRSDQLAIWAVTVGTNMMGYTPVFGRQVKFVLVGGLEVGDRKSTRLNSSHLGISYAVFCLKKKKIIQLTTLM